MVLPLMDTGERRRRTRRWSVAVAVAVAVVLALVVCSPGDPTSQATATVTTRSGFFDGMEVVAVRGANGRASGTVHLDGDTAALISRDGATITIASDIRVFDSVDFAFSGLLPSLGFDGPTVSASGTATELVAAAPEYIDAACAVLASLGSPQPAECDDVSVTLVEADPVAGAQVELLPATGVTFLQVRTAVRSIADGSLFSRLFGLDPDEDLP